ncbi:hypothetical protein BHE74_00041433 [Ensete ventricosum]|nr:hypothetical protein GW17_00033291 [Ensete ventricosum]RWW52171.1 hypothetical protein BHE74_00041433 [Ensete ventricosum]
MESSTRMALDQFLPLQSLASSRRSLAAGAIVTSSLPAGRRGGETLIRHRDRQRVNGRNEKKVVREREACRLEIWGFCNPTPSSPLYYAM